MCPCLAGLAGSSFPVTGGRHPEQSMGCRSPHLFTLNHTRSQPTRARVSLNVGSSTGSASGWVEDLCQGPMVASCLLRQPHGPLPQEGPCQPPWPYSSPCPSPPPAKHTHRFPLAPGQGSRFACGIRLPQDALGRLHWSEQGESVGNGLRGPQTPEGSSRLAPAAETTKGPTQRPLPHVEGGAGGRGCEDTGGG